nr:hypothetical protein [Micromonospora sp. DSM 115978]
MTSARAEEPTSLVDPEATEPERLDVVAVPAGWWVRRPAGAAVDPDDRAFAALPAPNGAITMIVGVPNFPLPSAPAVAAFIAALPPDVRDGAI